MYKYETGSVLAKDWASLPVLRAGAPEPVVVAV